jgi:hypothetical protein
VMVRVSTCSILGNALVRVTNCSGFESCHVPIVLIAPHDLAERADLECSYHVVRSHSSRVDVVDEDEDVEEEEEE